MRQLLPITQFFKVWLVFSALFLIFLASNYALFHPSFFHLHDFTHAARIAEMARALDAGQFPVRWSENFAYGFGMPLFNFYAPLPYFFGALFYKIGFTLVSSIKLLYLLISILTLFGSYLLGKQLSGRLGGIILAAAYTLAPYRALNLFVRGALSEALAMAFLPIVLWAIVAFIRKQDKKYLFSLVVALTSIILSHNLTALISLPLAALFAFLYARRFKKLKLLWALAGNFMLALLLSAFYILPAFLEKDATIIERIFGGYFHYSHHFLYLRQFFQDNWAYGGSAWGPDDDISFFLGFGQLAGLASLVSLLSFTIYKSWQKIWRNDGFYLILVIGLITATTLLMSTFKSIWLWDHLTILQYIQFPWRFLSAGSLLVAMLLALNFSLVISFSRKMLLASFLLLLLLTNARYFRPEKYLDSANSLYYGEPERIQREMSEILPDYIPKQMADQKILQQKSSSLPQFWLEEGSREMQKNEKVEAVFDRGFEKMFVTTFTEKSLVNFKIAYFPGWIAEINGQNEEILINSELGNIQILVPAGEHKITLRFGETTPSRVAGSTISFLALVSLVYLFAPFAKNKQ